MRQQSVFTIVIVQTLFIIMVAFILPVSSAVPSTVTMMTKFQTCLLLWLHISVKLSRVILVIRIYIRTCMSLSLENLSVSTHQLLHCLFKYTSDLVLYCGCMGISNHSIMSQSISASLVSIKYHIHMLQCIAVITYSNINNLQNR